MKENSKETRMKSEAAEDGPTRHLKHNVNLKAEKQIRIHGGYQWDLFRDKETNRDLPWAA